MYTISKKFNFSAGHHLKDLPKDHPCSNFHGHNYVVTVELKSSALNEIGFILDYRALQSIKDWINKTVDHKNLNEVVVFNPTAENLANYFFHNFASLGQIGFYLSAVTVSETDKTSARYEP